MCTRIILCAAGLAYAAVVAAEDGPKTLPVKGTTTYDTYYTTQTLSDLEMEGAGYQWVQEMVGVTRNTNGEPYFDNMSVRCLGYVQQVADEWFWTEACSEVDSDGDQLFATFDMEAHQIVGGTGKYAGISGTAPYSSATAPRLSPKRNAAVVKHTINWELKQ